MIITAIILSLIFFVLIVPTWVRMIVQATQRHNGTWNPESFHKWVWWNWRKPLEGLWIRFTEWKSDELDAGKKATAGWGGLAGRWATMFKPGDILLGGFGYYGFRMFQPLGFEGKRHLAMVSGTGTGKTTFLITMLGLHRGNAFVIDPKGQIAKIIARRRRQGGNGVEGLGKKVIILDPAGVSGFPSASWDPMDELARVEEREGRDRLPRYAKKLAEAFIPMDKSESKKYFPKNARQFIRALLLYVYVSEPPERRNIMRFRELLTRGYFNELVAEGAPHEEAMERGFKALLVKMQGCDEFGGLIQKGAATLFETGRSYGDILSSAREPLEFLDYPEIAAISGKSDFSLDELKLGNTDVFICAAASDIRETYQGWFRALTVFSLDLFEQLPQKLETPTLFAIDETPSLGKIDNLAVAAPVLRSYGVRLLIITQDVTLIKGAYPEEWTTFFGNADATYWMGTAHQETLSYLSDILDVATLKKSTKPWYLFWKFWERWRKETYTQKLLTTSQIGRILGDKKENMITTRFGKKPLRVKTMPYYKELPVKFYDADPDHKETPARAATRRRLQANAPAVATPTPETVVAPHPAPVVDPAPSEPVQEPVTARVVEPEPVVASQTVHEVKPEPSEPVTAFVATPEPEPKPEVTENIVPIHDAPKAAIKLSVVDAAALFGVSGMYTLDDLDARRRQLLENGEQPDSYKRFVEQAYDMLAKPLKFEAARAGG